jgi:dynein heavy chain
MSTDKHWIMFDGPVDALWIESMNTVLDDNKKLCLNSGQILTLTPHMTMMFEVEDLAVASPATVSRCGMVYMEPQALGIDVLFESWIERIPANIRGRATIEKKLRRLIKAFVEPTIKYLRTSLKEVVTTMDNNICQSLMRIVDCFLVPYTDTEIKKITAEELDHLESILESLFMFSFVWSFCCTIDFDSRLKMDLFLKELIKKNTGIDHPPNSVYEYFYNQAEKKYVEWSETNGPLNIDSKMQYHEIMIPTTDSARNIYFLKLLITNEKHVLNVGPTGTGKSLNINQLLTRELGEDYQYISMVFSAQTGCNQTQDTIDGKLDKRRKGVYGPPIGKKFVIFVDDLNMPKKEEFGAQPPIELLRQYLDHKGWYNRKDLLFMKL